MVFTSLPLHLDPSNNNNNWPQQQAQLQQHQQTNHHQQQPQQGIITSSSNGNHPHHLQLPLPTTQPPAEAAGGGGGNGGPGSIKPGSMADRARMAKSQQPEIALKCPRCDSLNTKFCYFNNYNLSQPRHFCKTCRRYWTRGGALRNVPVGGGCRRNNKRSSKSCTSSKSPVKTASVISTSSIPTKSGNTSDIIGLVQQQQQNQYHPPLSQLPNFMASLQHQLNVHHHHHNYGAAEIGFNFGGIFHQPTEAPTADHMEFNTGNNNSIGAGISLSSRGTEQWRLQQLQQFPFLSGLEQPPPRLYPFDGEAGGGEPDTYVAEGVSTSGQMKAKQISTPNSSVAMHNNGVSLVKMEDNNHQEAAGILNLSRQFLGIPVESDHQYLGVPSNAWTDLSAGFTSSSSNSHHLL